MRSADSYQSIKDLNELEKEADEYFKSICKDYNEEYERTGKRHYFVGFDIKKGYIAGAESREERIAELEKELEFEKSINGEFTAIKKLRDLESQIEKMKCCAKCSHCNTYITTCIPHKRFVRLEDVCEDFELRR